MDYSVAICTHNRSETVGKKILAYLQSANVPPERVTLFVTPGQEDTYRQALHPATYGQIATGGVGLRDNRNAVVTHFPPGHPVIQFDDDVEAIMRLTRHGKLAPVPDANALFEQAFTILAKTPATIWGVYPVANPFYMTDRVSAGLLFLIGQCMGFLNRPEELVSTGDKDDYERSLLRYETDGLVLRFDGLAAKAGTVRSNKGGLQDTDRIRNNNEAARYLMNRWPAFVRPKKPRSDGYMEIRLLNPHTR